MRQFMICFAGFVKSARSTRVGSGGKAPGKSFTSVQYLFRLRVYVVCLFYAFVLEPDV